MGAGPEVRVIGVDLDDTVLWREVSTRLIGYTKNTILRQSLLRKNLGEIPELDHTTVDVSIRGPLEIMSAFFHFRRTAIPGMAEMLREEITNGVPVYGISGRRATKAWYEMTQAQLIREKIPLTDIFLTPKGSSGLESKADSIRELRVTDFYEDDKRTLLYLAKLFPHVRFNYIDHGLTHLTEKDLTENTNITVLPIMQLSRVKRLSEAESAVRNSELREKIDFIDPVVGAFHRRFPRVAAWQVTATGVAFSIAGIELAEHQNRTGKHPHGKTAIAIASVLLGATLDLLDGKLARVIREEMTDEVAKDRDEEIGQALDPLADGVIEGWQAVSSAITSRKKGDRFAVSSALLRLATTNLPRTAKAVAGCFGIPVPETYRIKDLLRGDIRFLGTSLGRKGPNYLATFANTINGVSVQAGTDAVAVPANAIVAAERLGTLLTPKGEKTLSGKEMRHARFRTTVLGAESLIFAGIAYALGRKLLSKKNRQE